MLIENSSELLAPDEDVTEIAAAYAAVDRLRRFLEDGVSEEFDSWFRAEFGMGPDLRKKRLWDDLVG
jgi:hypothetical protein